MEKFDCSGWATKAGIKCSDGRIIDSNAFKHHDKAYLPLIWNHAHNDPLNVLGKAYLEHRDNGMYAYLSFNETESGQSAKALVQHGDVSSLSIYANKLVQEGPIVKHGVLREVSLVLSGANPGAYIDSIVSHDSDSTDSVIIYSGEDLLIHNSDQGSSVDNIETISEEVENKETQKEDVEMDKTMSHAEETVEDVFNTLTDKQKDVVYYMIGAALEKEDEGDDDDMKQNAFDRDTDADVLTHSDMQEVIADAKRMGSMKESFLAHGITDIEYMFPDAKNVANEPVFISRDMDWVSTVMMGVSKTPFARIKTLFADITEDDARAKGYIKGNMKKDEVFTLLKRTTTPTTIYKKQKLDRDDVVDITDFDVIGFIKKEMRMMLDEEAARAILVGDGRLSSSDDKINEQNIRPIWKDEDLFTIKTGVTTTSTDTPDQKAKKLIRAAVKARKDYKGSGNPTFYTTEDTLTDMLLMEDLQGRIIYDSEAKLATALRVRNIVTSSVMENLTRVDSDNKTRTLAGLIVNLKDYNVGADKGGAVNMFDDFDIDYNAQKYLIETRMSGSLIRPYSAIALELVAETVTPPAEG